MGDQVTTGTCVHCRARIVLLTDMVPPAWWHDPKLLNQFRYLYCPDGVNVATPMTTT